MLFDSVNTSGGVESGSAVSYTPCSCYVKWLEGVGLGKPCCESLPGLLSSVLSPSWYNLCHAAERRQYKWCKSVVRYFVLSLSDDWGLSGWLGLDTLWPGCSFILSGFPVTAIFFNWPSACGKLLLLCLSLYSATRVSWLTNDIIQRNPGPMWWWRPWRVEIWEARGDAQAQGAAGAVSDSAVVMQRNADYLSWAKLALKNKMIAPNIHKGYHVVNLDVTWSCKLMKERCLKKLANVYLKKPALSSSQSEEGRRNHRHEHLTPPSKGLVMVTALLTTPTVEWNHWQKDPEEQGRVSVTPGR